MSGLKILQVTVAPTPDARKILRAVVQSRGRPPVALWEFVQDGRMLDLVFAECRHTPFSAPLKRLLLCDLESSAIEKLGETGGLEWMVTERYCALMLDIERLLASCKGDSRARPTTRAGL